MSRLRVHKKLGGDTAGTTDPNWPKRYPAPYDIVLSSKSWGKKEQGEMFGVTVFVFPRNHYRALLSWRWLNTCLPMRSGEWIPYLALLVHAAFALPIKQSLYQHTSFLTFALLIVPPIPPWGGYWVSSCVGLSCPPGLNHNTKAELHAFQLLPHKVQHCLLACLPCPS